MLKLLHNLFSPTDAPGTGAAVEDNKMSHEDMIDFMGNENEEQEEKPEEIELGESEGTGKEDKGEKGEKEEGEDEEREREERLEGEDDEIVIPVRRKEILAKYPNLFKDFPHLDKAVYREQQYAEVFPTIKEAQDSATKANTLDSLNRDLEDSNTTRILKAVKNANPEAFNGIVDNYLGQLKTVDESAYYHVLSNVIKHTIIAMANSQQTDYKQAAQLLNHFVFGTEQFTPPFNLSPKSGVKDEREAQLEAREVEFRREVLDTHVTAVNTRIENSIKSTIDKNIDPRESMTSYVRNKAMDDCQNQLEEQIQSDARFRGLLDKLWERSAEEGFSQPSLDRIRSAYLSKAKSLLPEIIRKIRSEALRGKRSVDVDDEPRRGPLPVGQTRKSTPTQVRQASSGSDKDRAKAIPKGMRSIDYLMKD